MMLANFLEAVALLMVSVLLALFCYRVAESSGKKQQKSGQEKSGEEQKENKSPSEKEMAREQTRGLYIVGLLAILITIRLTVKITDPITDAFLVYLTISLGVYSFLMIFAYADLPNAVVIAFKELARIFLWMGLFVSIAYFGILAYEVITINPPYYFALYVIFVSVMAIGYYSRKRLGKK
jgi:cation transport ATPase